MMERKTAALRTRAHLALFDADTLTAKGIKDLLVSRSFPTASMRLFATRSAPETNLSEFAGEAMLIAEPDPDALGRLDLAFLCGTAEEGSRYLDWPRAKGFVGIDLTTASNETEGVPLVNMTVNPEQVSPSPGLIATPHPIGQFVSSLLAPVVQGCGLVEAAVVVFQPASECGAAGIEELYQQALGLLNFRDQPRQVFGRQLAFNLIPASLYEAAEAPGGARRDRLEREIKRVTGGAYRLSLEVVLAPIFHCHTALAHLTLPAAAGRDGLLTCYADSQEITLGRAGEPATPVERAGMAGVRIAAVEPGGSASTFWTWAISDNLVSGSALNAVRIAETLLDKGLGVDA
jgi:aspartate-semialdehyde dehydrogenase